MDWPVAQQVDEVFAPDIKLIVSVRVVTQQYHRGLITKDEYLDALLELINREF